MLRRVGPVAGPGRREDALGQRLQGERGLRRKKGMASVRLCLYASVYATCFPTQRRKGQQNEENLLWRKGRLEAVALR